MIAPPPVTPPPVALRDRLKRIAPLVVLIRLVRALATPLGRGRLRAGAGLFQPATVTRMDRHPALFALLAAELAAHPPDRPAARLLSFGCSTGEEAFTLAGYLPHAAIDAIDANPACIAQARRAAAKDGSTRIRFACADAPDALADAPYDAVLCLSVLRHGDLDAQAPGYSTAFLPFARFAAAVEALDRVLRPGGLLVLWGCNFRFADTDVATRYRVMETAGMPAQPGPFYGPGDALLAYESYGEFVFVKQA